MPASIAGIANLLIYCLILNANWIISAISISIAVAGALTYYTIYFRYVDYVTMFVITSTMLFVIYALYKAEMKDKSQLLYLTEIKRMNEELKNILMALPDGIVLINEKNGQVVLNNEEFSRIFQVPLQCKKEEITSLIRQKSIKIFNSNAEN